MIDIHCHILPGIDDGSNSLTESLVMAREAANEGIEKIIATPHHKNGLYTNVGNDIIGLVEQFNNALISEGIPVEILPGQETRIYGEIIQDLDNGKVLPLNITSGYVLIELPTDHVPQYTTQLLFDMQIAGYKPIIANPEKNEELNASSDKLYRMVKNGAFTQVSSGSLMGKSGKKIERFAHQLIEANLTHFIASDAHNIKKQGFNLRAAYQRVSKRHGESLAQQFQENSERLATGKAVSGSVPERIKHGKKWGIFN